MEKGSPKRKPKKDIYLNKKIVLDLYLGKKQPIQSIALLHTPKVYPKKQSKFVWHWPNISSNMLSTWALSAKRAVLGPLYPKHWVDRAKINPKTMRIGLTLRCNQHGSWARYIQRIGWIERNLAQHRHQNAFKIGCNCAKCCPGPAISKASGG